VRFQLFTWISEFLIFELLLDLPYPAFCSIPVFAPVTFQPGKATPCLDTSQMPECYHRKDRS
jgi:hypothetical protein